MRQGVTRQFAAGCALVLCAWLALPGPALARGLPDSRALAIAGHTRPVERFLAHHGNGSHGVEHFGRLTIVSYGVGSHSVAVGIDARGRVKHYWKGWAAWWDLLRIPPGTIGGRAGALWVYLPLAFLFLVPFVDLRRKLCWRNLDLLALVAFGVPFALFNTRHLALSAALALALLTYLCARMLALGRRAEPPRPARLNVPVRWLGLALIPLCITRVVLDLTSRVNIDVAHFDLIGADRLAHLQAIYGYGVLPPGGDHYGPAAYAAYIPFEALMPYHRQTDPAAAHWAGIAFDLLTIAGLFLLGSRLRDRRFGVVLAYAWAALPLTLFALCTHANDGLVALLVVLALLTLRRPIGNGFVVGVAAMAKIAPVLVAPLFLTHPGIAAEGRTNRAVRFMIGFSTAVALALAPALRWSDPETLYQALVNWQSVNITPFSIWGLLDPSGHGYFTYLIQSLLTAGVLILALVLACRPQRRTTFQLVALSAALLIGIQLPANYWLFTYASWFLPLVLLAVAWPVARQRDGATERSSASPGEATVRHAQLQT